MQYDSIPVSVLAHCDRRCETAASATPPPQIINFFLTRERTTQSASCSERSASSRTILFEPRMRMEQVFPGLATPVILTTRPLPEIELSSASAAVPSLSGVNESTCA